MLLLTLWSFGSLPLFTLANPTLERPALLQPRSKSNTVSLQVLQSEQPTNGLPSNLNVTLQFVGLGVGVQNYSCASATSEPVSVGAVATLFDVTSQLKKRNDSSADLSNQYLRHYKTKACTPNTADLSDDSCQESINTLHLPRLGVHYFDNIDGAPVPSFDLRRNDEFLSAQKVGDVPAPIGPHHGQNSAGAVDWLLLTKDGSGRSVGLTEAYRINTAGGTPVQGACGTGEKEVHVKYVAEYWFFK